MKPLRERRHGLQFVYVPAALTGLLTIGVFSAPFAVVAVLVGIVVLFTMAVFG